MQDRDLSGRCGTCAFWLKWHTDASGVSTGECRIWKSNRIDSATCSSYKAVGTSWKDWSRKKPVAAGTPRRLREEADSEPPPRIIPREIDIDMDQEEFRRVLRDVIQEELGIGEVSLGDRWRGGEVVLIPGKKDTQEKRVPLDAFFHKIVMIRDRLRVLEQKINGSDKLTDDEKVQLQQYVTACYGTLTTFNVLFKNRDDGFAGQRGKDD